MNHHDMKLHDPAAYRVMEEQEVIAANLDLRGKQLLELGCGGARTTRLLAERFAPAAIMATEVDHIQHRKNLAIADLPTVSFRYGGAQSIDAPDHSFDVVLMFKSLHHVPAELMAPSLGEIHRVLRPGGLVYFSEPVYWGPFNDIPRLFHDEEEVRRMAFEQRNNKRAWPSGGHCQRRSRPNTRRRGALNCIPTEDHGNEKKTLFLVPPA